MNVFPINDTNSLSTIPNPFLKDCVESIVITTRKKLFDQGWLFYTVIKFENGDTSGKHEINANSWEELLIKTKIFIENIK